jgi:SRSO17 transposase
MLHRAFRAGVPAAWVTADEVYGGDSKFRQMLEKQGLGYVVAVSCQQRLFLGGRYARVDEHVTAWPSEVWRKLSCGCGTKRERIYEWAFLRFGEPTEKDFRKGLLVRRSLKDPNDRAYYLTCANEGASITSLVYVAGTRWAIEECFEQAKQETGLDGYEVRSWRAWHRHITLAMFAHAMLAVIRSKANARQKKGSVP